MKKIFVIAVLLGFFTAAKGQSKERPIFSAQPEVKKTAEVQPKVNIVFTEKAESVKPAEQSPEQKTSAGVFGAEPAMIPPPQKSEQKIDKKEGQDNPK